MSKFTLDWKQYAALARQAAAEGCVLLENKNNTLPLAEGETCAVFGRTQFEYYKSGTGSGGLVNTSYVHDLDYALTESSLIIDEEVKTAYKNWLKDHPFDLGNGWAQEPWCQVEMPLSDELVSSAASRCQTALIVIGRTAGEDRDNAAEKGSWYLTDGEEAMLEIVCRHFSRTVVILNVGNIIDMSFVDRYEPSSVLYIWQGGMEGGSGAVDVITGKVPASGRLSDTIAYHIDDYPSTRNFGCEDTIRYEEDIYVGYRYFETFAKEKVRYPFGYGLSYTDFDWEVTDASANVTSLTKDGEVTVKVKVTNKGSVAGKDVVELYYTAPYITGEIEKSSVELGAFAKTEELQPGESQELTLTIPVENMASYDAYDSNHNGFAGYELDAGDYIFTVRHDAHTVDDDANATIVCTLSANVQYPTDKVTGAEVSNKFTGSDAVDGVSLDGIDSEQNIVYLTRADFEGTFPKENVDTRAMTDNVKALNLYTAEMAEDFIKDTDEPVTTGAKNGLKVEEDGYITELGYQLGKNYDDPQWDSLLDQLTKEEMENLYLHGYVRNNELPSIGKPTTREVDGPSQAGSFNQASFGTGYPNAGTMAQTWNAELAGIYGQSIGQQAAHLGYDGLYAPATNMHRSPFDGRNYEYYSEDSLLSGTMCGKTVEGAKQAGIYMYVKHFICNDGESGMYRDAVYTWMTEQALREIYLKPFQMLVEDYGATALMSSYNRIGAVWAGGSEALLTSILRDEWGFHGAVVTDYSDHQNYMNGDQSLRAGGSLWMDGWLSNGAFFCETSSNTYMQQLRRAAKNVIYMYLNARAVNQDYAQTVDASILKPATIPNFAWWKCVLGAVDVVVVLLFALSVRAVAKDKKRKGENGGI